jgi:hypothetical protein
LDHVKWSDHVKRSDHVKCSNHVEHSNHVAITGSGVLGSTPTVTTAPSTSQIELATPVEDDEDRIDVFYNGEPLRYRTVTNIIGNESSPDLAPRLFTQLHLTHAGEPTTYAEAKGDPTWEAAMKQELESMEKNRTWELVNLPTDHRPISLKWVFKLKKDEKGLVTIYNARLVARGFIQ